MYRGEKRVWEVGVRKGGGVCEEGAGGRWGKRSWGQVGREGEGGAITEQAEDLN